MKVTFDCDDSFIRPVISIDKVFDGCKAMIDTGALFPVWTASEESLKAVGAKPDSNLPSHTISGIGGNAKGNIYKLSLDLNGIHYIDLPIIAIKLNMCRFHMLLPSTMFKGMDVNIDYGNSTIEIDTRSNQVAYNLHYGKDSNDNLILIQNG